MRRQVEADSGFTLHIADIDTPRWFYQSIDKPALEKLMEILNQMKDDALSAAASAQMLPPP